MTSVRLPLNHQISVTEPGANANPSMSGPVQPREGARLHYFDQPQERVLLESAATLDAHPLLWDWPFSKNGVARCSVKPDEFTVELDFSYLKNMKHRDEIKKFDNLKNNSFMWQIGLSPTAPSADDDPTAPLTSGNQFWRFEMHIIESLNMICIEATRQIGTSKCYHTGMSMRDMRKIRRVFKIPAEYDIGTLEMKTTINGTFFIKIQKRTEPEDPIGPNRLRVKNAKLKRSETFA